MCSKYFLCKRHQLEPLSSIHCCLAGFCHWDVNLGFYANTLVSGKQFYGERMFSTCSGHMNPLPVCQSFTAVRALQ